MKTIETILIFLESFFQEIEESFLSDESKITIPSKFHLSRVVYDNHWYTREYFNYGLRFLIGIIDEKIYIYLRAEYVGGYAFKGKKFFDTPDIPGYVLLFSETFSIFKLRNPTLSMEKVFTFMNDKKQNFESLQPLSFTKRLAHDKNFLEFISPLWEYIDCLFINKNSHFTPYIKAERNPFTLRMLKGGSWIRRSYEGVNLLFGDNEKKSSGQKPKRRLYLLVNADAVKNLQQTRGLKIYPSKDLPHWRVIYVNSMEKLTDEWKAQLRKDLELTLMDLSTQIEFEAEKEEEGFMNALPDN